MPDQIADRRSGLRAVGCEMINVAIARVAEYNMALFVEHHNAVRKTVHGLIEDRFDVLRWCGRRGYGARHIGSHATQLAHDLTERRTHSHAPAPRRSDSSVRSMCG
jgi:hypothetical protein